MLPFSLIYDSMPYADISACADDIAMIRAMPSADDAAAAADEGCCR